MKKLLHVEVEPLSERQWAKIDRSLMARSQLEGRSVGNGRKQPAARFPNLSTWLAAGLAVSLLAVVLLTMTGAPVPSTVEHPSRIATGQSASHLAFPGLAVDVEPQSAVLVGAETPIGLLLVLDRGSIVCQVAPRPTGAPLIVQAGAVRVKVVGTRFRVLRQGEGAAVEVYEGVVEVTAAGHSLRLHAGQRWPEQVVSPPSEPSGVAATNPMAELAAERPGEPVDTAGRSESEAVSTPASQALSGAAQSARAKEGNRNASPASAPMGSAKLRASKPKAPTHVSKPESAASDGSPKAKTEVAARSGSQALFEQATALERSDPARASRLYRDLESGNDTWAQHAAYARGRLAAARGDSAEARRLLERYLDRFPRGSNAHDARAVLQRLR
jgi:FecR protein